MLYIFIFLILLGMVLFSGYNHYKRYKIEILKNTDFDQQWKNILSSNLALYEKLPGALKEKLHGLINVFLSDKVFSGYNGLEVTDEIRVTVAAQACLLLLNRDGDLYPSLKNIYMYPSAFKSLQPTYDGPVKVMEESIRIGESWHLGHVVLSWHHSQQGGRNDHDGHNVVFHEFAHQLDHQDGAIDGTPILDETDSYKDWSDVFSEEFNALRKKVSSHRKSLIDYYGATSEGEFFAVVTELFFEKPVVFKQEHPKLYAELEKFYHLNPAEWFLKK